MHELVMRLSAGDLGGEKLALVKRLSAGDLGGEKHALVVRLSAPWWQAPCYSFSRVRRLTADAVEQAP